MQKEACFIVTVNVFLFGNWISHWRQRLKAINAYILSLDGVVKAWSALCRNDHFTSSEKDSKENTILKKQQSVLNCKCISGTQRTHTQTTLPSRTLKNMSLHKICTNKNCRCRKCNWKKGQRHKLAAIITILAEKPVGTRLISQQTKSLLSLYLKQCLCPVLQCVRIPDILRVLSGCAQTGRLLRTCLQLKNTNK